MRRERDVEPTTYGRCPHCGQDLENGVCRHWVAELSDDGDGYDTVTPLYFGWTDYWTDIHEGIITSMDKYFEALCALCEQIVKKGAGEAQRILQGAKDFPSLEKATLQDGIKLLDEPKALEDYDSVSGLFGRLDCQMKDLFGDFVLRCGGRATKWEISGQAPGYPEWSGTNYWAEDAQKCIGCVLERSRDATARLRKLRS
jgi:hypothetical protein